MASSKHNRPIFQISKSCGDIKDHENKKQSAQPTCRSEPFLRPNIALSKVTVVWKQLVDSLSKKPCSTQIPDVSSFGRMKSVCQTLDVETSKSPVVPSVKHEEGSRGKKEKWKKGKRTMSTPEITRPSEEASSTEWQFMTTSAVKITLDPKTAHPFLFISKDRRRVRSYTHEESCSHLRGFILSRNMYTSWMCTQAEQAFSSGQHYWEVDVRGIRDWRIGVMKDSAPKVGYVKLNTSSGYWTLRLQLGRLVALTEPVTKLNIVLPCRVGVYLDMQGGRVSFYDIHEGRKHQMYSFQVDFSNSEKIYPVFGTVDTKKELAII